jgi:hypothetical protein
MRATLVALAGAAALAALTAEAPVRIEIPPGRSSATVEIAFPGGPRSGGQANPRGAPGRACPSPESAAPSPESAAAVAERRFVLAARAGQTLRIELRAPAENRGLTLALRCPGDGHTGIGRRGSLQGSVALPESGDYTILIRKTGSAPIPGALLQVELAGSPNRIAARPYTGTYFRQDGSGASIDVREALGGDAGPRLAFSIAASRDDVEISANPAPGTAHGIVTLRDGVGVHEQAGCRLTLRFGRPGTGELHVDETGECGLGHAVAAGGDYRRTSLCAAPADAL